MDQQQSLGVYPPFFERYISLVKTDDWESVLSKQASEAQDFFSSIPEEKWSYKYEEDKWTIKEVLQHITDTERVFNFRALAFSRKDPNSFPSFNQDGYVINSNANQRSPKDLIEEFLAVRKCSQLLFKSLSDEQLNSVGTASNKEMSVKAIAYIIAGHFAHHVEILKEKYLTQQ